MRRAPRECGAGCGTTLRRGHARTAYVLTCDGALHRTLVCPLCARRGVLTVAHLDEPLRARPPLRTKPRKLSTPDARGVQWFEDDAALPSVGTMSRAALEDEALPWGIDPDSTAEEFSKRSGERAEVLALSREALEARVAVQRAQRASSSGTVRAPSPLFCSVCTSTAELVPGTPLLCRACRERRTAGLT